MALGWIRLHRQIMDCEVLWDSADEPFDRRSAWIDLLLMANHKDLRIMFRGNPITVKCGQRITSLHKLAERWHWGINRVRHYLDLLQGEGMIVRESDNTKTLLTIVNYQKYQGISDLDDTPTDTVMNTVTDTVTNTLTDTVTDTKQELKRMNKNEKKRESKFIPPSLEEVQAYCKERKNNVNPKAFFDYYSAGEWKDSNGKPVRNWKQRVLTWESHEHEPKKAKSKGFNNIEKTDYDFDDLERKLMEK